jgi:uncharacterized protein (DUF58 family)
VPFVRENEDDEGLEATVILDNALPPAAGSDGAAADPERAKADAAAFETAVSQAASVSLELLHRGLRVALVLRGGAVPADAGPAQATRILRALALVEQVAASVPLEPRARPGAVVRIRPGAPPELGSAPSLPAVRAVGRRA